MARRLGSRTSRILACVLVALGAFFLTCTALLPTYTKALALKTPLDLEVTAVAKGNADILDVQSLAAGKPHVDQNVPVAVQRYVTVQDPSNGDIMTIQVGQTLSREDKRGNDAVVNALVDRVTVDRKTSMPVQNPVGSVQSIPGAPAVKVKHTGLQYKFPFYVEKKAYPYFDITARTSHPINFVNQTEIDGMKVYHFSQKVPVTDLSQAAPSPENLVTMPASTWGLPGGDKPITMHRYYTDQRDIWVDPVTGTLIKVQEQPTQWFGQNPDDHALTVRDMNVTFDQKTIEYQIDQAKSGQDKIAFVTRIVPIGTGIFGFILLVGGMLLGIRAFKRGPDDTADGSAGEGGYGAAAGAGSEGAAGEWGHEHGEAQTEVFPAAREHEEGFEHEDYPTEEFRKPDYGPDDER